MIPLTYKAHADQGAPRLTSGPDDTHGIAISQGERGRWLITPDPQKPDYSNQQAPQIEVPQTRFLLSGDLRADLHDGEAELVLVFWQDAAAKTLHSTERVLARGGSSTAFAPFTHTFTFPDGAAALRIDLRAWTGRGSVELRDLRLETAVGLPLPPVVGTAVPVSGYMWGDNLFLVRHTPDAPSP
jgi:hypothetical protein